ncbi:MAG: capsule biosynthesis protein, partial [Paracoccaceae bacterium]
MRRRHRLVLLSFVLGVLAPLAVTAAYLWYVADDQYASTVAFSVRKEEVSSAIELLGGITSLSGSSSSDTDILYEFLQSQDLVAQIDAAVDLRTIWSKPVYDPVFDYDTTGTIEDLTSQWEKMIKIYYDSGTGLIELRVLAFDAEDAHKTATVIYAASTEMINKLSDEAREDAIRYARDDLNTAVEKLKDARAAVTSFRNRTQIIDPTIDLQSQANLLGSLQAKLAEALIEVDLLAETTQDGDPRMEQALRRVRVTEDRITEERRKLGLGDSGEQGQVYA